MTDLIKANDVEEKAVKEDNIENQPVESGSTEEQPEHFFTTSTFKLLLMSFVTFGLYDIYWFYKNWVFIKSKTKKNIWPFWRSFFLIFWVYALFSHILGVYNKCNLPATKIKAGLLAILYIIISLVSYNLGDNIVDIFITFLVVVPIILINKIALKINNHRIPNFKNNTKFSLSNYVAIGIGGILWLLIIYGSFMDKNLSRGDELYNNGKYREAVEFYDKAIEHDPESSLAYSNKCAALHEMKEYEKSLEVCDKAIEYNSKPISAYFSKGSSLHNLGRYKEAIEFYDKAIEYDPKSNLAYNNKCVALNEIKEYERSLEMCDKAIEYSYKYHHSYANKGMALYNLGKYKEAIIQFDKAIEYKPDSSVYYRNKALILEQLGQNDEAQEAYDAAAIIDAKSGTAK